MRTHVRPGAAPIAEFYIEFVAIELIMDERAYAAA